MTTSVLWFRRDLRLADHPALLAAQDSGDEVVPLFVLDDALRRPSGAPRLAFLHRCLRELEQRTGGALRVLAGPPEQVVARVVRDAAPPACTSAATTRPTAAVATSGSGWPWATSRWWPPARRTP
jgi:deoxyribodipyrimidine photo-lyase